MSEIVTEVVILTHETNKIAVYGNFKTKELAQKLVDDLVALGLRFTLDTLLLAENVGTFTVLYKASATSNTNYEKWG